MRPVHRVVVTSLALAALSCSSQPAALRGAPDGTFQGRAPYRGANLESSRRFRSDGDMLRAYFDSPDLLLLGQPLDSVRYERPRIRFTTTDDHPLTFEGTVAGDSIMGTAGVPQVPGVIDSAAAAGSAPLRFT